MDYLDEYDDARPRYLFRGGGRGPAASSTDPSTVSRPHFAACVSASFLLSVAAYFSFHLSLDILFSLLLWFSISLLIAPFAPSSATGGPVYVGGGPALPEPVPSTSTSDPVGSSSTNSDRRSRSRKQVDRPSDQTVNAASSHGQSWEQKESEPKAVQGKRREEEERGNKEDDREWTEGDLDLLRKQMSKYPVARDPNRWEKIAAAFEGRHGLESVIHTAKSEQQRKAGGDDLFDQFLKKRKPCDPRKAAAKSEFFDEVSNI